jgi:DNA processing protein
LHAKKLLCLICNKLQYQKIKSLSKDLLYKIALTQVPNIGTIRAKAIAAHFEYNAKAIFKAKWKDLAAIEGVTELAAKSITEFDDFSIIEREMDFIEKYKIQVLFLGDKQYPKRLMNAYDSPTTLYYRGHADLNAKKIVAIIGTRQNTDYSKKIIEKLMEELVPHNALIVSGLAFGVDTLAHKAALKQKLSTVGVLAHGLDQIYPAENTKIAKDMIAKDGGLLTEFVTGGKADRHNFPIRNRIVAAMSDVIVVVETDIKGGSMITAELANNYKKDVVAFPGRTTDPKSKGCNYLIKTGKAKLITEPNDLINLMGWQLDKVKKVRQQRSLFIELTPNEKKIVDVLQGMPPMHIDEVYIKTGLTSGEAAAALLTLELQAVVHSLPGKMIELL